MNVDGFKSLFDTSIRAWLNWSALDELDPQIQETVITDRSKLGELRTVWYVTEDGKAGDWRDPNSRTQDVAEASLNQHLWSEESAARIQRFRDQYNDFNEPLSLVIPAYRVGDDLLLLDSTHRAVAAFLSNVEIRLLVLSVEGPIDSTILPDLHGFSVPVKVGAA